jgi:hypothetical protein
MRLHSAICLYAWVLVCNNDVNKAVSQFMFSQLIRCRHRGGILDKKNQMLEHWNDELVTAVHGHIDHSCSCHERRQLAIHGREDDFDSFARARQVAYLLILFAGLPRFRQQSFKLGTHQQLQCRESPFFIFSLAGRPGEWSELIFIRLDVR